MPPTAGPANRRAIMAGGRAGTGGGANNNDSAAIFFHDIHTRVSVSVSVYSEPLPFSQLQTEKNQNIKTMFLEISIQMSCLRFEVALD